MNAKYNFHLDVIRVVAILGVVAIHVWYPVYSRPDFLGGFSWWLADLINSFSRIAVPWFILISGSLLLPRRPKDEAADTGKRLGWRLLLPLLFWSVVYFWWDKVYYGRITYPDQALRVFFTGSVFHLYFLVILFGLYLFLPLWRRVPVNRHALTVGFGVGMAIYALQFFLYRDKTILNFFTLWVPYLGYFLAGPTLLNLPANRRRQTLAVGLWLASVMVTMVLGFVNLGWLKQGVMTFWGIGGSEYATNWLSPNVILMSLAGFYWLSHIQMRPNKLSQWLVKSLARASLGIYLIHLIVINLLDKYLGLYLDYGHTRLWWYGSYKFVLVFSVSYFVTLVAVRLPLVKLLWGEKK